MKKTRIAALLLALALCLSLLPMAAMAEEEHTESYTITFDANGGQFPDGSAAMDVQTQWLGAGNNITAAPPDPVREGYTFDGWDTGSENSIGNVSFTADATVKATWKRAETALVYVALDPNGGTVTPTAIAIGSNYQLADKLPTPTRSGYIFEGWYRGDRKVDQEETYTGPDTLKAQWTKEGTPEQEPEQNYAGEVWFHLEGGTVVSVGGIKPDSSGDVLLPGGDYFSQRPDDGDEVLGVMLPAAGGKLSALPVLEKEGCTFDGWYTMETGGNRVTTDTVFTRSGKYGRAYVWARWTDAKAPADPEKPAESAKPSNPNGPFTVKFDLNYINPKLDEVPKEQKVQKGSAAALPDGAKLTPPSGYEFYAWCAVGSDGKLFPWNESHAVTGDMTLYAGWIRKDSASNSAAPAGSKPVEASAGTPETSKPAESPDKPAFTDVALASPFAPAIAWAVEKKITNGKTATTFAPGEPCTRAQIVTFLWRAAGSPEPKSAEAEYADVTNAGAYYYKAIQWAAEMGMEESGTFAPDKPCTRGQAMYFIWKARASASSAGAAPHFTDLSSDSLYYDAVLWAVGQGVTNGTGDGTTFSPDNPCTRGQIVTFLYRAYEQ